MLLLLLPLFAQIGASQAEPPAELRAEYDGNGSVEGDATGTAALHRILYDGAPRQPLTIRDVEARFLLIETRYNHTNAQGAPGVIDPVDRQQDMTWFDIQGDKVVLDWPHADRDSLMVLRGPGYLEGGEQPMMVTIDTTGATWSAPRIYGDGIPFMWHDGTGSPGWHPGGVPDWHRTLGIDDGAPMALDQGFVLHLRQARLTVDGEVVESMPPYVTKQATLTTPLFVAGRTQTTLTDAFLFVDAGRTEFPLGRADLAVSEMNLTIDGDVLMNGASGSYRIAGQEGSFSRASLGLAGRFDLIDVAGEDEEDGPGRGMGRATATGSFSVIAVDYIVEAAGPVGPSLLEQAAWLTLFLGVLGLLLWFLQHAWVFLYSRIKEDAVLEHPRRAQIMGFVEANPGCHVLRVAEDLGLARGVARHHLMVLERAGRLKRFHESGQTLLVPSGQDKAVALRAWAEEDPHLGTIRRVVAGGGVRRAELVATLRSRHGVADPTARRWIEKAVRAGLIEEHGKGHGVTYRAGP